MNRYSRTKILIEDASIMNLRVFTALRVGETDTALKGLEQILPIEVTRHYDGSRLPVRRRNETMEKHAEENTMNYRIRAHYANALPVVVLAVLGFMAKGAWAQSDEVLTLDIESQQAGAALVELAQISGVQIMLASEDEAKAEIDGLKGEYRFEEALAALLTDTGLTYEYAAEDVVLIRAQADEQEEDSEANDSADDDSAREEEEEPLELTDQTVTGSRLIGGDPGARVYSFSAEEIYRRGVSSLEDFFRTLPWHFSSQNTQTGPARYTIRDRLDFYLVDVGVATANLRALGSRNTLVLMDGRRIAGVGGVEEDVVNLLDVPLSSIERVDIQIDGASAVYGADAIGGVVNFITKKRYEGLSANFRREFSSSDADTSRANLRGGYGWGGERSPRSLCTVTTSRSSIGKSASPARTCVSFRAGFRPADSRLWAARRGLRP